MAGGVARPQRAGGVRTRGRAGRPLVRRPRDAPPVRRPGGAIRYTNRFLRSDAYRRAMRGEGVSGFATGAPGLLARLKALLFDEPYDNANVIVERIGDRYLALTETPRPVVVVRGASKRWATRRTRGRHRAATWRVHTSTTTPGRVGSSTSRRSSDGRTHTTPTRRTTRRPASTSRRSPSRNRRTCTVSPSPGGTWSSPSFPTL